LDPLRVVSRLRARRLALRDIAHEVDELACSSCGHRAVALGDNVDDFKGHMPELRTLRFKCLACGSHDRPGWLFAFDAEQEAWLEGVFYLGKVVELERCERPSPCLSAKRFL
jgi:hypothetical protein